MDPTDVGPRSFRDWNLTLTVLEFIWGPLLGGLSGLFVHWARSLLIK